MDREALVSMSYNKVRALVSNVNNNRGLSEFPGGVQAEDARSIIGAPAFAGETPALHAGVTPAPHDGAPRGRDAPATRVFRT